MSPYLEFFLVWIRSVSTNCQYGYYAVVDIRFRAKYRCSREILFQPRDPRADLSLDRVVDCMAHCRGGRQPLLHLYLWTCLFARYSHRTVIVSCSVTSVEIRTSLGEGNGTLGHFLFRVIIIGIGRKLLTPAVLPRWVFATEQIFKDLSVSEMSSDMPRLAISVTASVDKHVYKHHQWNTEVDLPLAHLEAVLDR